VSGEPRDLSKVWFSDDFRELFVTGAIVDAVCDLRGARIYLSGQEGIVDL
jgi:hypothetical protein